MPGLSVQIPRTIKSIRTPLAEASYNLAMTFLSSKEFIFAIIYASSPRLAHSISSSIRSIIRSLKFNGATINLFQIGGSE